MKPTTLRKMVRRKKFFVIGTRKRKWKDINRKLKKIFRPTLIICREDLINGYNYDNFIIELFDKVYYWKVMETKQEIYEWKDKRVLSNLKWEKDNENKTTRA